MSIGQALSSANSGLAAVSRQASVVSNNIANALTEGYSRREVSFAEITVAGQGAGVRVAGVVRAATPALTAERRAAGGEASGLSLQADALGRIADFLGGPEDANALFARMGAFHDALRTLANAPASGPAQLSAVDAAKALAAGFNAAGAMLDGERAAADGAIGARVDAVNAALLRIQSLNDDIARALTAGQDPSALLDDRDRQIETVNTAIPVRVLTREGGRIDLMSTEGDLLLAGTARRIDFTPSAIITPDMTRANGALSGLSVDGVAINPRAGELAALFDIRDAAAPQAQADLDALAGDLIARLASAGVDPTLPPGAPGLFTDAGSALAASPAPGLAQRLEVNAAVDPDLGGAAWRLRDGLNAIVEGPAGSNGVIVALIGALDAPRASPFGGQQSSALEAASELSGRAGARRSSAASAFQSQSAYAQGLAEAERSQVGVDTDRELQSLLLIEQAYAANARVIEAAGSMIDRLMEL